MVLKGIRIEATPQQVRDRIDAIPATVRLPTETGEWETKLDGEKLKSLDRFDYLAATRISEVVTKQKPSELNGVMKKNKKGILKSTKVLNTGSYLALNFDTFEGEEVALFTITTLKREDHIQRTVALPLSERYEPWTKQIVDGWQDGNPWELSRSPCWAANRLIFNGLYYSTPDGAKPFKDLANHGLRHIRIRDLIMNYQFSPLEIQRFVGWTARTIGISKMMDTYFNLVWRDYFPKLLKE